jgi:predicted amidohydrolase
MFVRSILEEMDTDPLPVRKQFFQMELDMTLAMYRAGVPFMAGTDTAAGVHIFPGFSLHDELGWFVRAGLTPMQALQTATRNPAQFLGRLSDMGTVKKGKFAISFSLTRIPSRTLQIPSAFGLWSWRDTTFRGPTSTSC